MAGFADLFDINKGDTDVPSFFQKPVKTVVKVGSI